MEMKKNAKFQYGKIQLITSPGSGAGGFFFPQFVQLNLGPTFSEFVQCMKKKVTWRAQFVNEKNQ